MFRITNRVAVAAAGAGLCCAALALSPAAAADPAAPANPALPGLNFVQQLASDPGTAVAGLLQSASSMLTGGGAAPAAQPGAVASINLPQPASPPPAATASITLPQAPMATPASSSTAGLPLPAPLSVPSDLGSLLPAGIQIPGLTRPAPPAPPPSPLAGLLPALAPAPAVTAPAQNPITSLLPLSALP